MIGQVEAPESGETRDRDLRFRALRRFARNKLAVVGAVYLLIVLLIAICAPWIAPHDPDLQNLLARFQRPGGDHLLGTDDFGRDQLSRLMFGARASLGFSVLAMLIAMAGAAPLGLVAGYFGGRLDSVVSRFNEMLMSVPSLVLPIVVVAVLGPGLVNGAFAIGLVSMPRFFRLIRAVTLDVRGETYIEASNAIGLTTRQTIVRNVVPNVVGPLYIQMALGLGTFVAAEASLSFIGLGIPPPTASWGGMLRTASSNMSQASFLVYPPGILIALTVLAYLLVGDGLRSAFSTTRGALAEVGKP